MKRVPRFMHKTEAILFDLDGTLIDSAPDLAAAVNATMKELGRPPYDEETIRAWVGNGATTLIGRALSANRRIDPSLDKRVWNEALSLFMDRYRRRICDKTALYPDVEEVLRDLKDRGFKMGVVTNKPSEFVAPILEKLGIDAFFVTVLGGDDLPVKKPDPLPLVAAMERLGATPDTTVMVGDSQNDIIAAKRAGVSAIGVTWGYNYGEDIAASGPDAVIDDFKALLDLLR